MNLEHEFTVPVPVDEAWQVLLDVERVAPCMPGATLLTVDGDEFTGTVKVKVGPIQVTYKGSARFASKDDTTHVAVIEASGKESRGSGTASATVTTSLVDAGRSTRVKVTSDLNVTGRPAQFGRGVMQEVAAKLINQFADCLADELSGTPAAASEPTAPEAAPVAPAPPAKKATAAKSTGKKTTAKSTAKTPSTPTESATSAPSEVASTTPAQPSAASAPAAAASTGPRSIPPSTTPRRTPEAIDLLDAAGAPMAKRLVPVLAALFVVILLWRRRRG